MSLRIEGGFRALVVDDDELSRDIAASILRRLGATEVVEAASGAAAIAWADTHDGALDLILCDLRMPEFDGLETLEELARRTYPRVFVLASGADRRTIRAAAGAASRIGADRLRVVDKPVTVEKMTGIVAAMSEESAPQERSWDLLQKSPPECSTDMVRGLPLGEFIPFFVPQLKVADRRVSRVEAVWRWRHPRFGVLPPPSFLPVAETIGVLDEVFFSVFRQAVTQCLQWRNTGISVGLSVNIAPALLASRDLPRRLENETRLYGLAPHQVTLEIAETAWLQDREHAREALIRLRLRGFGLAIDDFGSGFSGIKQLLDAPFNEMKLDPPLVRAALGDRESAVALSSYLALARELDMTVVGQGITTQAERDYGIQSGCDQVQGELIGAPMTAPAFEDWMRDAAVPGSSAEQTVARPLLAAAAP